MKPAIDKKHVLEKTDFKTLYHELIQKFKETKPGQAIGLCPFHDDTHPSLSLNLKSGVYNCFSCSAKGNGVDLCIKVWGLDFKDTLHRLAERAGIDISKATARGKTGRPMTVATFQYTDATSKRLYWKERIEPGRNGRLKEFFFYHIDGKGKRQRSRGDHEAIPYHLHEIAKAEKIFFVEGEAKADLLASWGLAATCLDSGAKSKWHSHYTPFFEGKEVILIPDNDAAGEGYLQTSAIALYGKAKGVKVLRLPGLEKSWDVLDWVKMGGTPTPETLQSCKDTFLKLADAAPEYQPPASPQVLPPSEKSGADDADFKQTRGERGANRLFNDLTSDLNFRLVRNTVGECFAVVKNELLNLQGQEFRDFLCYRFLNDTGQPLRKEALNTVVMGLCAKARYEGELVETPLRVAKAGNKFYLDLGRTKEGSKVIEICPDKGEWHILNDSPILFRRGLWQKPQVNPVKKGNPWGLFSYGNIAEDYRLLILVTVITALIPGISHPALHLYGPQGSGKSFIAKLIKMLIDPTASMMLAPPSKEEDIFISCYRYYIIPIDNVDGLSVYLCGVFSSIISGGYIERRTLHTTLDITTLPINSIPIFTSINSSLHARPDMSERTVKIELQPIGKKQRTRETVLLEDFQKTIPEILGGMLDTVAKAMQLYPNIELRELPRMADWCFWGYAVAEALGGFGDQFLKDYFDNIGMQTVDLLDDNSLLSAISARMENHGFLSGTFKDILNLLKEDAAPALNDKSFPASPRSLRRHLERIRMPLSDLGITYAIKGKTSRGRIVEFSKASSAPAGISNDKLEGSAPEPPRDDSGDLPF